MKNQYEYQKILNIKNTILTRKKPGHSKNKPAYHTKIYQDKPNNNWYIHGLIIHYFSVRVAPKCDPKYGISHCDSLYRLQAPQSYAASWNPSVGQTGSRCQLLQNDLGMLAYKKQRTQQWKNDWHVPKSYWPGR
jgi:hypothetical protein